MEISGFEPAFDPEGVSSGFTAPPPLLFEGGVTGPLGSGSGSGSGSGFSGSVSGSVSGFSGSGFPEGGGVTGVSGSGVVSWVNNEEFSKYSLRAFISDGRPSQLLALHFAYSSNCSSVTAIFCALSGSLIKLNNLVASLVLITTPRLAR